MKRIIFKKNDLTELPIPETGYVSFGLDSDDKLKYVDDQGIVNSLGSEDTNISNTNLSFTASRTHNLNSTNLSFTNGLIDLPNTEINGSLNLTSKTVGLLMNQVNNIEMDGIVSPSNNLLVYNTDLKGIYRYDSGLLQWVGLSAGYGIIEVQSGTGTGQPTYFADLQSALETCKASGGYFTVKLYSNLTITSAIEIDYTSSGVGNAYLFRQLTIDFNGFSITNAQANTSNIFTIELSSSASVYQEVRMINGSVLRTNGTGTHHALKCDTINRYGTIQMSKMYFYCQNSHAARIGLRVSTAVDANKVCDLGGSVFVSSGTQRTLGLVQGSGGQTVTNFSCISTSSLAALYVEGGVAKDFYAENTSSGQAILQIGGVIQNFNTKSNTGVALDISGSGVEAHNFIAKSIGTAATAIYVKNSALITNFKADALDAYALQVDSSGVAKNGYIQNNSATRGTVQTGGGDRLDDVQAVNLGASFGGRLQGGFVTNCKFISIGGIGAELLSSVTTDNCTFESRLNTSAGSAVRVGAGPQTITKSTFRVTNASANVITASSAVTLNVFNNIHNQVATTPINANVTVTTLSSF